MKELMKAIFCCILCIGVVGSLHAQRKANNYPSVSSRVIGNNMLLTVDQVEYKISRIKLFSNFLLRYHVPTKTVYAFYSFSPGVAERVLVVRRAAQRGYNVPSSSFYLEPPFNYANTMIGRDRIPIFGSYRQGNVTFAPLSPKLLRLLRGDDKIDDIFVSSNTTAKGRFIRPEDFIDISKIPTERRITATLPQGFGELDTVICVPSEGSDDSCVVQEDQAKETPNTAINTVEQDDGASDEDIYQDHTTTEQADDSAVVRYGLRKVLIVPENG